MAVAWFDCIWKLDVAGYFAQCGKTIQLRLRDEFTLGQGCEPLLAWAECAERGGGRLRALI